MLWPFPFNHYPGTDYETFNWDWLLRVGKRMEQVLTEWESVLKEKVEEILADHPEYIQNWMLEDGAVTNDKLSDGVENCWYGIPLNQTVYNNTDSYYVAIPYQFDSEKTNIFTAFDNALTPGEYARAHNTEITINANIALKRTDDTWTVPACINNGQIIYDNTVTGTLKASDPAYLCIDDNGNHYTSPITSTPNDLINNGAKIAFGVYYPIVSNSMLIDLTNITGNESDIVTSKAPRTAIGFRADKTMVLFACDGRTAADPGLTSAELAQVMLNLGCIDAWAMDGGGSTSLSYRCSKVNRNIDDYGATDRMIRFTLNVKKPNVNDFIASAYSFAGMLRALTTHQIWKTLKPFVTYESTTDNPLDVFENDTPSVSFRVLYFEGDDCTWSASPTEQTFKYSTNIMFRAGPLLVVLSITFNGSLIAWNFSNNGTWYGWHRIGQAVSTTDVLEEMATQNSGVVSYYLDDAEGMPSNNYLYGTVLGILSGATRHMIAWSSDGIYKAERHGDLDTWGSWTEEKFVDSGSYNWTGSVAVGQTTTVTIPISNPKNKTGAWYTALATCGDTSGMMALIGTKNASSIVITLRNVHPSATLSSCTVNWIIREN